uniref:BZIP domain-containing protein n=1 Tax=Trichuris muris TaxID=70415 RepID=A0A5S6Q4V3_TRIMR
MNAQSGNESASSFKPPTTGAIGEANGASIQKPQFPSQDKSQSHWKSKRRNALVKQLILSQHKSLSELKREVTCLNDQLCQWAGEVAIIMNEINTTRSHTFHSA